jgi:hypothetical protein
MYIKGGCLKMGSLFYFCIITQINPATYSTPENS